MIYFAQSVEGGPIKIGYTANLEVRHKQLESTYRRKMVILATMDGDEEEERRIHDRFAHLRFERRSRYGRHPEQFRPEPDLMEFIGYPLFVNQGDVELMEPVATNDAAMCFISIKTTVAFHDWLARIAETERSTIVQILEKGAVEYGEKRGFKDAPKRTSR